MGITRMRWAGALAAIATACAFALVLVTASSADSPIANRVSAGGPDACVSLLGGDHPGCDANYSLTATLLTDGTARGQWTDRFANGDGFHAVIDCVSVSGNTAWVSGTITHGTVGDFDLAGFDVSTSVQDNGKSANDPPDKISFSFIGFGLPCSLQVPFDLGDAPEGQVQVR